MITATEIEWLSHRPTSEQIPLNCRSQSARIHSHAPQRSNKRKRENMWTVVENELRFEKKMQI